MKIKLRPSPVTPIDREQAAKDYMRMYAHYIWADMPNTANYFRQLAEIVTKENEAGK